jgi:hypothetical protein
MPRVFIANGRLERQTMAIYKTIWRETTMGIDDSRFGSDKFYDSDTSKFLEALRHYGLDLSFSTKGTSWKKVIGTETVKLWPMYACPQHKTHASACCGESRKRNIARQ